MAKLWRQAPYFLEQRATREYGLVQLISTNFGLFAEKRRKS